jgi:hypothetical protein
MAEQSHREEMNEAIRAQRERQASGRAPAPAPPPPAENVKPSLAARLAGRLRGK